MLACFRLQLVGKRSLQAASVLLSPLPLVTPASLARKSFNSLRFVMSAAQDGDSRVARIKESIRAIPDWPKKGDGDFKGF